MTQNPFKFIDRFEPLPVVAWSSLVLCVAVIVLITGIVVVTSLPRPSGFDPLPAVAWDQPQGVR